MVWVYDEKKHSSFDDRFHTIIEKNATISCLGLEYKNLTLVGGWDRKIRPNDHRLASRGMRMTTNSDRDGRIFLSHPHTNNGLFFLFTTKYLILHWKNVKRASKKS